MKQFDKLLLYIQQSLKFEMMPSPRITYGYVLIFKKGTPDPEKFEIHALIQDCASILEIA
jgi:hypothetical protein